MLADARYEGSSMLERLARWSYKHRWQMLGIWIVALVGIITLGNVAGGAYSNDFSLPGAESQKALDLLKARFPARAGDTADIVFRADAGVNDPGVRSQMQGLFARISSMEHIDQVASPYDPNNQWRVARDGKIAFATIQFEVAAADVSKSEVQRILDLGKEVDGGGLQIEFGGSVIQFAQFEPPGGAEAVGLLAAVIILLITFGSVLAMGLPIMTALFGIGISLGLVLLFANFVNVPNFTPQLASMIGIGVGVDYALFIVTRYRQGLQEGLSPEEATVLAISTAGRAVLFAGTTVVISLLGILLMGFSFVQGIAVGGASAVLVTMLASVTLLPGVLGFVGRNIDKLHIPRLRRTENASRQSFWFRWSRVIQRRPGTALVAGLIVLGLLIVPFFKLRLGVADAGNDPTSRTTRRAYDLLSQGFGPGFNGPMLLVAELPKGMTPDDLGKLTQVLSKTPGVAAVSPPIPNRQGNTAIVTVYPTTSPQDASTDQLVHHLRDTVIPQTMGGTGITVLVGGLSPIFADFAEKIGQRLPVLIGVVLALSFILLMLVFRSLVVPVKAVIMNLLSIGAAYGVIVAIFQWGWLKGVVGIGKAGPIEAWAPMMLFTILFGLSMDYEIFLLSRVREDYLLNGRNNGLAVANGVAATGRVITAAAAIMVAVFLSFVLGFPDRAIKLFGLGLAVAIFVDATLVRMVLVPATMELLGDRNWWLPRSLSRILPKISVERTAGPVAEAELALAEGRASREPVGD
jgi:putative drug exporter of the RND superfamily